MDSEMETGIVGRESLMKAARIYSNLGLGIFYPGYIVY